MPLGQDVWQWTTSVNNRGHGLGIPWQNLTGFRASVKNIQIKIQICPSEVHGQQVCPGPPTLVVQI